MSETNMTIDDWRAEIDSIDEELLRLLNRRAQLAAKVAALKAAQRTPLRDAERERAVLERARCAVLSPLDEAGVSRIFQRILMESRRVQSRVMAEAKGTRRAKGE